MLKSKIKFSYPLTFLVPFLFLLYVFSLGAFLYANYMAGDSELWQLISSGLLLSIPLIALYSSIGILCYAKYQHDKGIINKELAEIVYYSPRIVSLILIGFITLFSFDVFEPGGNIWLMLGAFVMHSLPSIFLGIFLYFAWKHSSFGYYSFLLASVLFFVMVLRNPVNNLGIVLLFAGPLFCISKLFWVDWKWTKYKSLK